MEAVLNMPPGHAHLTLWRWMTVGKESDHAAARVHFSASRLHHVGGWRADSATCQALFSHMSSTSNIVEDDGYASDAELLQRMARGDESALSRFYDRHSTLLYSIAIKVVGDLHEAEEVLLDALRLIWERAALYDATLGQPLSWAVVITRHKAIDRLRALKRKSDGLARLTESALIDMPSDPSACAKNHACEGAVNRLHGALTGLPREQTAAIELAFFKGMSQSEIAAHLGVPIGTVKARIRRGMIALRDALEDQL